MYTVVILLSKIHINVDEALAKMDWSATLSHLTAPFMFMSCSLDSVKTFTFCYLVLFQYNLNIKKKDHAWHKWKIYRNTFDYEHFSNYRKLFHREMVNCFRVYIKPVEESISIDMKYFWSYIINNKNKANCPNNICNLFSLSFVLSMSILLSSHCIGNILINVLSFSRFYLMYIC